MAGSFRRLLRNLRKDHEAMKADTYAKYLEKAMKETSNGYVGWTTEALEEAVADISARLKGPLPNWARIDDCAERSAMRAELKRRAAATTPPPSHQ